MFRSLEEYFESYVQLSKDEKQLLSQFVERKNYDRKVRIVDIGEPDRYLHFILTGLVRKFLIKGKEQIVQSIAKEGTILATSASFYYQLPSNAVVETLEPTIIESISKENLDKLYATDNKWERLGNLMMSEFVIQKEYLLLDFIRMTPREKFLHFMKSNPDLLQRVPQKYLASYLEIKPETFSRLKHLMYLNPNSSKPVLSK